MPLVDPFASITNLQTAKDFLSNANTSGIILTKDQLQQIIGKMSGKVADSQTTLLYSGDITIGKNPDGSAIKIKSWQVAEEIGAKSGGKVATIGQTDIGKLIDDPSFRQAVANTAKANGTTVNNLLFGQDANGNRINNNSLSDFASERFVSQIEGKVQIMAGDISPNSIFAKTEFPEIISNNKITDIDGISRSDIDVRFGELIYSGNTFDQAVDNIRVDVTQHSYINTETNIKLIKPVDSGSHVAGIDTGDFFGRTGDVPHINTIPDGSPNVTALSGLFDASKLHATQNVLGKLGTAGDILAVTIAVFQANEAYAAGDTAGAVHIMEDWAAQFVGGIGGGMIAVDVAIGIGVAIGAGPVAVGALVLAGALAGGYYGGEAASWVLKKGIELEIFTQKMIDDFVRDARAWWAEVEKSGGLSDYITNAYWKFLDSIAKSLIDPLIIDLSNNGIALDSWQASNALFDLNGDGTKENTGWTKANGDDAFLVIDKNSNGKIDDITEMFGNASIPGFTELAKYDSNKDNLINSLDSQFSLLRLWNDKNANGTVDTGEMTTLAQNNITEISLNKYNRNTLIAGNVENAISTVTINGATRYIHELSFAFDSTTSFTANPDAALPASFQLNIATLILPYSRGYGGLNSWQAAMTLDPVLLSMAQDIAATTPDAIH